ncbi:class I poly(R)-hydroxyalkanoic acid synthase [uncultured Ruegeria sp.]|uniref:PHA/PHB synthase family protein n=1 Tax=uncultured Ruegeria sp. TaxID=259304 RepID=UPI002615559D|nr:class I poly(R)-hydroxyalkanoic acid synthase [uncultured Ruegeria sp.]
MPETPIEHPYARLIALTQRAAMLAPQVGATTMAKSSGQEFSIVDNASVAGAFAASMTHLAQNPGVVAAFYHSAALNAMNAMWSMALPGAYSAQDRRFKDDAWDTMLMPKLAKETHVALEKAMNHLLSTLPEGSLDHQRTKFYTRQMLSALSPSNSAALNPTALKKALTSGGASLLDGFENLLEDLERGEGRLDITNTDREAFEVGKDLATTPGQVVYQNDLMQLIQYEPLTEKQNKRPMLFVPAWINKYYILDMRPDNSLVRHLVEQGHTVFVISWVNPTKAHADKSFEDYMKDGPLAALDAIEQATGEREANILGFCIGGILVTATLAWLAAKGDDRIKSATTLASMIDFTDVGEIGVFIDDNRVRALEAHMAETGYLENHHLQDMFSMLRENDLVWSSHVKHYLMGEKPSAFDLLYWNADSTRLPRDMLLWYLTEIYLANKLRQQGGLSMAGVPLDVSKIKTPMFVLATKDDHIAPWKSVYPTTQIVGGPVEFVLGASGHIAGVINPPRKKVKYGFWKANIQPDTPASWLEAAEYTQASWWEIWTEWLGKHGGARKVKARVPGDRELEVIEDAPGSYVGAH